MMTANSRLRSPSSATFNIGAQTESVLTLAVVAMLPLIHSTFISDIFNVPKLVVIWLAGSLILLRVSLRGLLTQKLTVPKSSLFFLPFVYVAVLATTTAFSILPEISLIGARGPQLGLLTYIASLGLFVGGWSLAKKESHLKAFTHLIALIVFLLVGLAWLEYFGLDYPIDYANFNQGAVGALIGNSTLFGAFLSVVSPILIGRYAVTQGREKALTGIAVVFLFTGVALSRSSTAIIVTFLVGALMILRIAKRLNFRLRLLIFSIVIVMAGAFFALKLLPSDRGNIAYRLTQWQAAARIIAAKPLTGTGLGTGRYVMSRYAAPSHTLQEEFIGDAHNLLLNQAATTGVVAAVILLAFIGGLITKGFVAGEKDYLSLSLTAAVLSFFLVEQTTPDFPAIVGFFWIFAGILGAKVAGDTETFNLTGRLPFYLGTLFALAILIAAGMLSSRLLTAEYQHRKTMASKTSEEALDSTYKATQALPYYDYYYGNLATKAVTMSKQVSKDYLPIVKFAADKAIKINRFESKNYESLGFYYLLLDNKSDTLQKAARSFLLSLEMNPYNPESLFGLSKTYYLSGNRARGRRYRDRLAKYFGQTDQRVLELEKLDR